MTELEELCIEYWKLMETEEKWGLAETERMDYIRAKLGLIDDREEQRS